MQLSCWRTKTVLSLLLLAVFAAMTGCSRNPSVRKQKYLQSGQKYMARQKYREAAIQFANALRIDANFADAHYQLAQVDLKLGSLQNAYLELMRAVTLQPGNLQAQLDLGKLFFGARQFKQAQERAEIVLAKDANNIEAHELKADASAGLNDMDTAMQEISAAIQLDPKRADSYFNRGMLQETNPAEAVKAEDSFRQAIALDPKALGPQLALATFYDRRQRYDDGERQLRMAVDSAPKNEMVRTALVIHFLRQGKKDQAEQAAKQAKLALGDDPKGARFLAEYYLRMGNVDAATQELAAVAAQYPKDRDTQHAYLEVLLAQNGKKTDAMRQAQQILKSNRRDDVAILAKTRLLLADNKGSEARSTLEQLVKSEPDNALAHYQLGLAYRDTGDSGQAGSQFHEAARIKPDFLAAQAALADIAVQKGDYDGLADLAKTVKAKIPGSAEGYVMQATVDAKNTDYAGAEAELKKAIEIEPRNAGPYTKLGSLEITLKKDGEAEPLLEKALERNPVDIEALTGLARIYVNRKQEDKAVSIVGTQVGKYPSNPGLHILLARTLVATHDSKGAEAELAKAIELQPNSMTAYQMLAALQASLKESDQAIATYQAAIQKNPNNPIGYAMLGSAYQQKGRAVDAEMNYRKALNLRPDIGPVANNLSYLLLTEGGNIDEAISYAQIARRQMPDSAEVADTLGWAYVQKGTPRLATELLEDAVKKNPDNGTYHYHLGALYEKTGDRTRAKTELQKALQLDVGKDEVYEVKKMLDDLGQS